MIGSGIQATELTQDVGVQLLANSIATVFGLGILILLLGPVSGAHFNPVVTLAEWWTARRGGDGVTAREVAVYVPAQIIGAIAGAVLADAMFGKPLVGRPAREAAREISALIADRQAGRVGDGGTRSAGSGTGTGPRSS